MVLSGARTLLGFAICFVLVSLAVGAVSGPSGTLQEGARLLMALSLALVAAAPTAARIHARVGRSNEASSGPRAQGESGFERPSLPPPAYRPPSVYAPHPEYDPPLPGTRGGPTP